jgi:hypothetical protein
MQYTILLFSYHRKHFSFYRYLFLELKVQFENTYNRVKFNVKL